MRGDIDHYQNVFTVIVFCYKIIFIFNIIIQKNILSTPKIELKIGFLLIKKIKIKVEI